MIPIPPELLADLATDFHLTPAELTPLGGGQESSDGTTFRYTQDCQQRVLKILASPVTDRNMLLRLAARLEFVSFLGQHGAPIVYPLPRADGSLFTSRSSGETTFVAYSMRHVAGHHPPTAEWTPDLLRAWGKMIGATHRITRQYPLWQELTSVGQQLTDDNQLTSDGQLLGWQQEWNLFYNWCRDPQVKAYWLVMREKLAALPVERDCFGFIHNDPHAGNILVADDQTTGDDQASAAPALTLLDFDVANCHWFINDISIALQAVMFNVKGGFENTDKDLPTAQDFLTHFMQGYQTENELDPGWLSQLNLFINYRRALLFTVMQDWIETQPELHATWKNLILTEAPVF